MFYALYNLRRQEHYGENLAARDHTSALENDKRIVIGRVDSLRLDIHMFVRSGSESTIPEVHHQLEAVRTTVYLPQSVCNRNQTESTSCFRLCCSCTIYTHTMIFNVMNDVANGV